MKDLQKKILARIDYTKEDLLRSKQSDYKYGNPPSVLTAHLKGYLQALEHIKVLIDCEIETEEIRDDIEADILFQLEKEGFKHDFPTR